MTRRPPTPAELERRIVVAAQAWAAEVLASPLLLDLTSPEGVARLVLLDAVHDLEYHNAYPGRGTAIPLPFDDEPGTS